MLQRMDRNEAAPLTFHLQQLITISASPSRTSAKQKNAYQTFNNFFKILELIDSIFNIKPFLASICNFIIQ